MNEPQVGIGINFKHCLCGKLAGNLCVKCHEPFCDRYFDKEDNMCEPCYRAQLIAELKKERAHQEKMKDPEFIKSWGRTHEVDEPGE